MKKYLPWDSDFFNKRIFMVTYTSTNSLDSIKELISFEKPDLIYVFATPSEQVSQDMKWLGATLYDEKVTYARTIDRVNISEVSTDVIDYNGPAVQSLIDLAITAGSYSRFKLDQQLASRFSEMYTRWMTNSLNGTIADKVFVAKSGDEITGMVTCKRTDEVGNIGLIAVAPGQQGNGIGSQLISATNNWYIENGVKKSTVVTQLDNKQACHFYEKAGFRVEKIENIYHLWIDRKS